MDTIRKRKLKFYVHLVRTDESRLIKKIFEYIRGNHEENGEGQGGRTRGCKHNRNDTEQKGVQSRIDNFRKSRRKCLNILYGPASDTPENIIT